MCYGIGAVLPGVMPLLMPLLTRMYHIVLLCRNELEDCSHLACVTRCQEHSCESRRSDTYSEYENFEQVLAGLPPSPSLQVCIA